MEASISEIILAYRVLYNKESFPDYEMVGNLLKSHGYYYHPTEVKKIGNAFREIVQKKPDAFRIQQRALLLGLNGKHEEAFTAAARFMLTGKKSGGHNKFEAPPAFKQTNPHGTHQPGIPPLRQSRTRKPRRR